MRNSSVLIRFIDIGLIILFGFLSISDLENISRVDVGNADQTLGTPNLDEFEAIVVNVAPGGFFSIVLASNEESDSGSIRDIGDLEAALRPIVDRFRAEGIEDVVVLINAHENSIVQQTIDVMDVCTRIGVSKALARKGA